MRQHATSRMVGSNTPMKDASPALRRVIPIHRSRPPDGRENPLIRPAREVCRTSGSAATPTLDQDHTTPQGHEL
jgi:hypothetical protein